LGDYHRARWRTLQKMYGDGRVIAADLAGADDLYRWESTRDDPDYVLLSEKPVGERDHVNRLANLRRCVEENDVTTICLGFGRWEYIQFILYARLRGLQVIIFDESWYPRKRAVDYLKGKFLNTFASGFFLSGKRAYNHFTQRYGIPPERIETGYNTIDVEHFARPQTNGERENILLCVARYSEVKNLKRLIRAFLRSRMSESYTLQLVGDGPQKEELAALSAGHDSVELKGWVSYDEIPKLYHRAKIVVLPSSFEPWGLVVNEALAAGLPVIASQAVGAAPDLVTADNGSVFHEENEDELVAVLDHWAGMSDAELNAHGAKSTELSRQFTLETWATRLLRLIEKTSD
jgi:glycosyltransferase involved in cell wall biosynthesis